MLRFVRKGCVAPTGRAHGATSPGQGAAGSEGSGTPSPRPPVGRGSEVPPGRQSPCMFVPETSPLRVGGIPALTDDFAYCSPLSKLTPIPASLPRSRPSLRFPPLCGGRPGLRTASFQPLFRNNGLANKFIRVCNKLAWKTRMNSGQPNAC